MQKDGFDRVAKMLARIGPEVTAHFAEANRLNAEEVVDLAKVLIPQRTGASRAAIGNYATDNGGQLLDFGKKAKVIEGDRGPRAFVNPAMDATKASRKARNKAAMKDVVKALGNG
jgi:hypothetical protein